MKIKKGDQVVVIAGKDKGKTGKVSSVSLKDDRVTVENVSIVSKHKKPRSAQDKGGIMKKPAPIDVSNVMIICPACGKATRIAHKELDGKKARVCKKCGASLDKEFVKAVKKENKNTVKTESGEKPVKPVKAVEKKPAVKTAPKAVKASAVKSAPKTTVRKTVSSSGK